LAKLKAQWVELPKGAVGPLGSVKATGPGYSDESPAIKPNTLD